MSEQSSQCEQCQQRYNLFRRKRQCLLCGQTFCSKCLPRSSAMSFSSNSRRCVICLLIINERTTSEQLAAIRAKHLRAYLIHSKVVSTHRIETCLEKRDLVDLIESEKRQSSDRSFVFVERPIPYYHSSSEHTTATNNNYTQEEVRQTTENQTEEVPSWTPPVATVLSEEPRTEPIVNPPPPVPPATKDHIPVALSAVSSLESIHDLTIRQLRDILNQNYVSIQGCIEKKELIDKVELLYRDLRQTQSKDLTNSTTQSDENLCKVCMDATIDCVFLNCGHLCTCIQCGKRLSECPFCRSNIVRVVRVFKT